jgi:uncharacterized protein with GYD domain
MRAGPRKFPAGPGTVTRTALLAAANSSKLRCAAAAFGARGPGRCAVPTYVLLANWTEQGIRGVKESPRRLDTAKKALKEMGGEFKSVFLTLGDYDLVVIYEAPDDAVAARFNLQLGMQGNIRTRTMKAFPEAAYREIITSLG